MKLTERGEPARYALTAARSGRVLSSTRDRTRAQKFTEDRARACQAFYAERRRKAVEAAHHAAPEDGRPRPAVNTAVFVDVEEA